MSKYLKKFETQAAYEAAYPNLILPNVSLIVETNGVAYNPYVPLYDGFCKLILNNGETVELEGSGELTFAMTSNYKSTLVSAEIGTLCTSIGNGAFAGCSGLTSCTIGGSVTTIGTAAFNQCSGLTSCTIGSGVTSIGNFAFQSCKGLTSIDIPNSVTSIGNFAFQSCKGLTSIVIPSGVTSIGQFAFDTCSGATTIVIGSGVTTIAQHGFGNMSGATTITCYAMTAPTINNDAFRNIKTNGTLYVPQGSTGYDIWMQNANYYLGQKGWTKVEQ